MVRKVGHALHDILEAIDPVEEITRGKTLAEFEQSWQLRWLVQRAIRILKFPGSAYEDWQRPSPRISGARRPTHLEHRC